MDIYHHYKEILQSRSSYKYEHSSIIPPDIDIDKYVIERELIRKDLYNKILEWLKVWMKPYIDKKNMNNKTKDKLGDKNINHILLRYLLNKIITKLDDDDPVFIFKQSSIVEEQLKRDKSFLGLTFNHIELMNELDSRFADAYDKLKNTPISEDAEVILSNGILKYKGVDYEDWSKLGEIYPKYKSYAVALNIRYTYIHLENHNLAREYKEMGFEKEDACEAFASAFNHYFNTFCSAFPDLEKPYGSIGSFFNQDLDNWNKYIIFVNPPFDEILMDTVFDKIIKFLEEANNRRIADQSNTDGTLLPYDHHYIITVPNWTDWKGLNNFKDNLWTYMTAIYMKGEMPFINYMEKEPRRIMPVDVAELFCKSYKG
jgi:hypothetical protein